MVTDHRVATSHELYEPTVHSMGSGQRGESHYALTHSSPLLDPVLTRPELTAGRLSTF